MRVNSAFTGYFNRLLMSSGIAIAMLAIFFIASSFEKHADPDLRVKHVNLIIRQIGDRLLLLAGDSTSRVLPVTATKDGTFLLNFENEFVFNHDSLITLTQNLLPKTEFASGYTVTVHDCMNGDIAYGFSMNNTSPDIVPCRGRIQPPGCYALEFAFPDLSESIKQKATGSYQLAESVKADRQKAKRKSEELKTAATGYDQTDTEEFKSAKTVSQEGNSKLESKIKTFDYSLRNLIYGGILLLGVTLLILRFRKILKPIPVQNQNHIVIKESIPELPALGKFLFNVKGQHLLLGTEVIDLTDKECKVLELLHNNFGELIPRETLMQEVWINEGVITSRSLDMFVSKLRKKLSADPNLRITNIHGKGYKLEPVS